MQKRILPCIFIILTMLSVGCSLSAHSPINKVPTRGQLVQAFPGNSQQTLEHSQQLILYALNPQIMPSPQKGEQFQGYSIFHKVVIANPEVKHKLIAALYDGIAEAPDAVPPCFSPRHGMRAVWNGKSVDLLICFECKQVQIYASGKEGFVGISSEPQALLNQLLAKGLISQK